MFKIGMLVITFIMLWTLSGCYTGEMELEAAYIRKYRLNSFIKDGQTHIKITGYCGLPMGVVGFERRVKNNEMKITMIISEDLIKERTISEEFPIPNSVTIVKMGEDVLWTRTKPNERRENLNWDSPKQ